MCHILLHFVITNKKYGLINYQSGWLPGTTSTGGCYNSFGITGVGTPGNGILPLVYRGTNSLVINTCVSLFYPFSACLRILFEEINDKNIIKIKNM